MPGRTETPAISYKEVDSVSESSESSSDDEEDQELKARLEASGAPLVKRKRAKKKSKSSDKSRKRRRQKGSRSRASKRADPDDGEEDDTPWSEDEGTRGGAGKDGGDGEALQAANPLGKLPSELIHEIFSYLDLGDLIQLARTSPTLNAMLLAPSAQSIWSRSRRNAGYVLFPGMSEIEFALMMEGSLCQYCGAKGDLEVMWLARLCKECKEKRAGPVSLHSSHPRPRHGQLLSCIERVSPAWHSGHKEYILDEVETANMALHEAQKADDAGKAAQTTGSSEGADQPSHVQRYVAERKVLLADRAEARKVNRAAQKALRLTQRREFLARRKIGVSIREGMTLEILRALQDRHGWTVKELAELEVRLLGELDDEYFADGMLEPPPDLPHCAPLAWKRFRADFRAQSERTVSYDLQRQKTIRQRAEFVQSCYKAYTPALAVALRKSVDDLPTWYRMEKATEVRALFRLPLTFLQEEPSADFHEIFKRTAPATMVTDRVTAIRYALAAQLDISVSRLSSDPADYPASKYNKTFFDRLINRFEVGRSAYLTYNEALEIGYTARKVSRTTRAAWRRAIGHVLRAARIKDTERSLDKLDALGAAFRWTNGPRGYSSHKYDWRTMVDLLVQHGPKELHLTDLQDIKLVYKRIKAIDEKDKDASTSANKLAETEGGKTATTSSSDRVETDDMGMAATTANDSSLNASTSNSSPGTAATAATASATARAAAFLGLRRSNRLGPKL